MDYHHTQCNTVVMAIFVYHEVSLTKEGSVGYFACGVYCIQKYKVS